LLPRRTSLSSGAVKNKDNILIYLHNILPLQDACFHVSTVRRYKLGNFSLNLELHSNKKKKVDSLS